MTFPAWLRREPLANPRPRRVDVRPGMVLNRTYRILKPLASGGVGRVYLAAHERLPGQVAVKVLHRNFLRDKQSLARFRNEAEILAGLNHPNVVKVLDYNVSEGGIPYLVMELIEGVELRKCIGQPQQRDPLWVASAVHQVAAALRAAHMKGVVHRDVKPENLMVCSVEGDGDFVKVLDFGVSNVYRLVRKNARRARAAANDGDFIVGTPGYMAPEQLAAGQEPVDDRADQFGLAAVAWELLTGRPAFVGSDEGNLLYKMLNEDPPPLAELVSWPSAEVDAVLHRALAKERDLRYPDIQEFSRALEMALAAAVAPPAPEPPAQIEVVSATAMPAVAVMSASAFAETSAVQLAPEASGAAPAVATASVVPPAASIVPPLPESDPAMMAIPATPVDTPVPMAAAGMNDEFADVGHSYLW